MSPMLTSIRRPPSGGAVVSVEGSFDAADADQLGSIAFALDADGPVTLDFHEVQSAGDMAVVRLARGILEASGHVSMVGLSEHHHRLLTYIGLEPLHIKHDDVE
jgi:anti-anti-sigma regulatory factor